MSNKTVLYASEGKLLTDGTIYGKMIYLADGVDPYKFYEITEEEYQDIRNAEDNSITDTVTEV